MRRRALLLALLTGCAGDKADTSPAASADTAAAWCAAGPQLTWDNWAAGFYRSYCTSCHSAQTPDRNGAPAAFNFDTEADAAANAAITRHVVLDEPSMPIGGGVFDQDLVYLDRYLHCNFGS